MLWERGGEKPLLAGASVTGTMLFGAVVPAALMEAASAVGEGKGTPQGSCAQAQSESGAFVPVGGDSEQAGEWSQKAWLES